jgi:hypothetical protein
MWFVSRQCYWPDGQNMVEIAEGGLDYANPDMLVSKYSGEGTEYEDPREAVTAALEIAKQWKADKPDLEIEVSYGNTMGFTMPFEGSDEKELREWAEKRYKELPKCDRCGELIKGNGYILCDDPDYKYCSEYCAEKSQNYEGVI